MSLLSLFINLMHPWFIKVLISIKNLSHPINVNIYTCMILHALIPLVSKVTGSESSPAAALLHALTRKFMNLVSNLNPVKWKEQSVFLMHKSGKCKIFWAEQCCQHLVGCIQWSWCCPPPPSTAHPSHAADPRGWFFCTLRCNGQSCCPPPAFSMLRSPHYLWPDSPRALSLELLALCAEDQKRACRILIHIYYLEGVISYMFLST